MLLSATVGTIGDQQIAHSEGQLELDLAATNDAGAALSYSAAIIDAVNELAISLDQELGLTAHDWIQSANYFEGAHLGQAERYLLDDSGMWHYILPSGEFHYGNGDSSVLLPEIFYDEPQLLANASDISLPLLPVDLTLDGNRIRLQPAPQEIGTAWVTISADDGTQPVSEIFRFIVTNAAPELAIGDQQISHTADHLSLELPAFDADGDSVTYSVQLSGAANEMAADLDRQFGLTAPDFIRAANYYEGVHLGQAERYLLDTSGTWHYILPTGEFHAGNGSPPVLLPVEYYNDPWLLANASEGGGGESQVNINATIDDGRLILEPIAGFSGTATVTVGASDGIETTFDSFRFTVSNSVPQLSVANREIAETQDLIVLEFDETDADGDRITYSVTVVTEVSQRAIDLDRRYGLDASERLQALNYHEGVHLGQAERYLSGADGSWHYILPNGEFHVAGVEEPVLLSKSYYDDPTLLANASVAQNLPSPVETTVLDNRIVIDPVAGYLGTATVTIHASDGVANVSRSFRLTVTPRNSYFDPATGITVNQSESPAADPALIGEQLPGAIIVFEELSKQVKRIEADGRRSWSRTFDSWSRDGVYANGLLYVVNGPNLHAIDPTTGYDVHVYNGFPANVNGVSVEGKFVVLSLSGNRPVEIWQLSNDGSRLSFFAASRQTAIEPRKAVFDGTWLTVADTFGHRVFRENFATGEVQEFEAYFPNDVQLIGPDQVLVTIEHENKVVIYDWITRTFQYVFGANFHTFSQPEPDPTIRNTQARTGVPNGRYTISRAAVEISGRDTLYSPNRALQISENEYLIADTDNHRIIFVRDGQVVSELASFNTPTGIAVILD